MKILVTGCAGFIGFHLAKRLTLENHDVVGVDNLNDYYSPTLKLDRLQQLGVNIDRIDRNQELKGNGGFIFICSDILDPSFFNEILKGMQFDVICNFAAQVGVHHSIEKPSAHINSNIHGFFNILEYCRNNPKTYLIFASSSSVYGKNHVLPFSEKDITDSPLSLYAATKKSNELMAHCYSTLFGIKIVGLRLFTVYGPWGRPDMIPFLFTKAILENKSIRIFNNGDIARDFTYVDDVVEGIYRIIYSKFNFCLPPDEQFHIYNIAKSEPITIDSFITILERLIRKKARKIYEPTRLGDVNITWGDSSLLQQDYDYKPSTSIETGLKKFLCWYEDYYRKCKNHKFLTNINKN